MGKRSRGVRLAAPAVPYAASTWRSPTNGDSSFSSNGDDVDDAETAGCLR